jgi:hypothetical protein
MISFGAYMMEKGHLQNFSRDLKEISLPCLMSVNADAYEWLLNYIVFLFKIFKPSQ